MNHGRGSSADKKWALLDGGREAQDCNREDNPMKAQHLMLPIVDLRCSGALIVEQALAQVPGVRRVYVSAPMEMAYVEFEPAVTELSLLIATVEHAGFRTGKPTMR
jgi:hypothetical protein